MPRFRYTAFSATGQRAKGSIEADNQAEARASLREQNLHVTSLKEAPPAVALDRRIRSYQSRRARRELTAATRQLGVLLSSGMPMADALETLCSQVESKALRGVLADVRNKVLQGSALADAMHTHSAWFPDLYVSMTRAGEATGNLGSVLQHVALFRQKRERVAGRVSAALTYPAIMVVIGVAVVMFLLAFVVPRLAQVLTGMGRALPVPTLILIRLSDFAGQYWWLVLGVMLLLVGLARLVARREPGRSWCDRALLRVPVFGRLFQRQSLSRVALTLSALLRSGVPVLQALNSAKAVAGNLVFQRAIGSAADRVMAGQAIAASLKETEVFPALFINMVAMGEQRGNVDETLAELSQEYEQQTEVALQRMIALLEPIIIVIMAGVVAFIVLAILLPILEVSNVVG